MTSPRTQLNPELAAFLTECAPAYDPERRMLGVSWNGPGYHTRVPNGTWAHPLRESLTYALALLESEEAANITRAHDITRAVLAMQETDPYQATYGIWPWLQEEPLEQMAPPDWNWADFCGARLAQMLVLYSELLPNDLREAVRTALGHAGWSIFRRNVQPSYTNIAIMGAGVTLAAGELLNEPRLLAYGRSRLRSFVEYTQLHGGFNEYNSPTYTFVAIEETERILCLVRDPQARADAEWIRYAAWQTIAEHFHPATGQWAGPYSRTYSDLLAPFTAAFLQQQTGVTLRVHPRAASRDTGRAGFPHLPCPPDLVARFAELPATTTIQRSFIRRIPESDSTIGTTWLTPDACLGSINYDTLWTQRRPLLGYWRTDEEPAVVLRLRFLHDGQDFASSAVSNVQREGKVLSTISLVLDAGDFHPTLDCPSDGIFTAERFVVRYELTGEGVRAEALDSHRFALSAGSLRAVIHTTPSRFDGQPVHWQIVQSADSVALEGVCYDGPPRAFDLAQLGPTAIVAGLEILDQQGAPSRDLPQVSDDGQQLTATWGELSLVASRYAQKPQDVRATVSLKKARS